MAFEITHIENDLIFARIIGLMCLSDQQALQNIAVEVIAKYGKARLLAIIENFQGWGKGVDWGDIDFLVEHADDISKMAIVGYESRRKKCFYSLGRA